MKIIIRFLFLSFAVSLASAQSTPVQEGQAGDETDTTESEAADTGETTTSDVRNFGAVISGNEEQPKVLYIVPWKSAGGDAAIPYRPIRRQTDTAFSHIERSEHIRHLEFMESLSEASE